MATLSDSSVLIAAERRQLNFDEFATRYQEEDVAISAVPLRSSYTGYIAREQRHNATDARPLSRASFRSSPSMSPSREHTCRCGLIWRGAALQWGNASPDQQGTLRLANRQRLPVVAELFHQASNPGALEGLKLPEVLEWAGAVLNRVDRAAFFSAFERHHAVQYFYEPFLEAFDPELRRQWRQRGVAQRARTFVPCHAKKCTTTIELVMTNAVGTSQRAVCRILAASLRWSLRNATCTAVISTIVTKAKT